MHITASVFMISLGTIWMRTRVMSRWLYAIIYLVALVLLLRFSLCVWMVLIFPGWVFVISVYILIHNLRHRGLELTDALNAGSAIQRQV